MIICFGIISTATLLLNRWYYSVFYIKKNERYQLQDNQRTEQLYKHQTNECNYHPILNKYLTHYKKIKGNHKMLRNQFEDVTNGGIPYLLNILFHRDEFQKHIKVVFVTKNVPYDGNYDYHSILKCLTLSKRCNTVYDCLSLHRDIFDNSSTENFINSFKRSMANLYDLNEDRMSQEVSAFTYLENVRSNMNNDKCTPKEYYSKHLWFTVTTFFNNDINHVFNCVLLLLFRSK